MSEILEEVAKLSTEERHILFQRLNELEEGSVEETPELLAAIDEADASPEANDLSVDEIRRNVSQWARPSRFFRARQSRLGANQSLCQPRQS